MKVRKGTVDATPSKRLYLSIIADYDANKSVCELVDNALDIWVKNGRTTPLAVQIIFDQYQQRILVCDNAGGLSESELSYIVGPGHTGTVETDETIGIFGVGTKRAVVALAQDITIKTRQEGDTHLIAFDDAWIKEDDDWRLPVYKVDDIPEGTTLIELVRLRQAITDDLVSQLKEHLGATYALFLQDGNVTISVNDVAVEPITFDDWAFPPGFEPREYTGELPIEDNKPVKVHALAGLTSESSPGGGEYGVYVYCNDRLVARALKTYDVGFATGLAGKPHADISLARVIISLHGPAKLMPWNSSKSDINPSHEVFVALRNWLLSVVKDYTSLARRLSKQEGGWSDNVFKYDTGNVKKVDVEAFPEVKTSYLPPLPKVQRRYGRVIKDINKSVSKQKPWTTGLYESVIAVDLVLRQDLEQKNRIALILLDSTLEIAFKEYLVKESKEQYSEKRLQGMFRDRRQVHTEVAKHVGIADEVLKKINHYYDARCQLIHRRATISISETEIMDFREIVENLLGRLFGLRFK